jgi:CheY-like chemotaxis protein
MKPTAVNSGTAALVELERACLAGISYPLVLLDVMMPNMDGLELTERIRAFPNTALAATRLIIMSSAVQAEDRERTERLGVLRTMNKPVKQSVLLNALATAFGPADEEERTEPNALLPAEVNSLRVLLAEDGLINQKVAINLLEMRGHSVVLATNGREAIDALLRQGAQPFDVVLMDVQMPVLDGLAATREIRDAEARTGGHVFIVAMTASAMKGDREKCLAAGMDDYLSKPIQPKELYATVERFSARIDLLR